MTVYDDMCNVKYRQPNTYMSPYYLPLKQIRVRHGMFKVTSFVHF